MTLARFLDACSNAGLAITSPAQIEAESGDYGACRLGVNGRNVVFRVAKTTPTKIGQFVTVWKRPAPAAEIAPFDAADGIDRVVVSVGDETHQGFFLFDQATLIGRDVFSRDGVGGKRAIRVYPPWCTPLARQALASQRWQLAAFIDDSTDASTLLRLIG